MPLTPAERTKILTGLLFVNTTDADCDAARREIESRLFSLPRRLYKGNPEVLDAIEHPHDAATTRDRRLVHVDSDFLLSASPKEVAALLLHEGWHANGTFGDHDGHDAPPYPAPYNKARFCVGLP